VFRGGIFGTGGDATPIPREEGEAAADPCSELVPGLLIGCDGVLDDDAMVEFVQPKWIL